MFLKKITYSVLIVSFYLIIITLSGESEDSIKDKFNAYIKQHGKNYRGPIVYQEKLKNFNDSLLVINKLNAARTKKESAYYSVTIYSDMTASEFSKKYLRKLILEDYMHLNKLNFYLKKRHKRSIINKLPQKVDWRLKNVIGDVQSQKNCGACWSFATIATIESSNAMATGKFVELSSQQLIDCVKVNDGCNGGDVCTALRWQKYYKNKILKEEEYPLKYMKNECSVNNNVNYTGVQVTDYSCKYLAGNEEELLRIIAEEGPVSVAVNAYSWQHYHGGVIQYHCNGSVVFLNHAAQIVGYDLTSPIPHYIVRNSWGKQFGNDGYLYIAVGNNVCGIANRVSTVKTL